MKRQKMKDIEGSEGRGSLDKDLCNSCGVSHVLPWTTLLQVFHSHRNSCIYPVSSASFILLSVSKLLSRCCYFLQQGGNHAVHVRGRDGWVWVVGNVSQSVDEDFPPAPPLQALIQSLVDPVGWVLLTSKGWWMHCSDCYYFIMLYWWGKKKSSVFLYFL